MVEDIFRLYAELNQSMTFQDFCEDKEAFGHNIDAKYVHLSFLVMWSLLLVCLLICCGRRFILFGLVNGILRRTHLYPVAALPPDSSALKDSEKDQKLLSYVLF
jgi:hypothetical protein